METPPSLASLRAQLTASLDWPGDIGSPVVTLINQGPATARHLTYSLATPPDIPPPHCRAGPWEVDQLQPGENDQRQVYGFYPSVVLVTAAWTDDEGVHDLTCRSTSPNG